MKHQTLGHVRDTVFSDHMVRAQRAVEILSHTKSRLELSLQGIRVNNREDTHETKQDTGS